MNQIVPADEADRYKGRIEDAFAETLAEVPHLADRVDAGRARRALPLGARPATGSSAMPAAPAGPSSATPATTRTRSPPRGWLDAFRDAELLADAVDRGLDGDLAAELAGYQQARDAAAMPMYEFTCGLANIAAPPTAEMLGLVAALDGNPAQISRFLGLIAGSIPIPEFFSPESLGQIMAEAVIPAA